MTSEHAFHARSQTSLCLIFSTADLKRAPEGADLLPIRLDLYWAVKASFPNRCRDLSDFLTERDWTKSIADSYRLHDELFREIRSHPDAWVRGTDSCIPTILLSAYTLFSILFRRLIEHYDQIYVVSRDDDYESEWDNQVLAIHLAALRWAAEDTLRPCDCLCENSFRFFRWARFLFKKGCGDIILRGCRIVPHLFLTNRQNGFASDTRAHVIIAGLQITDVVWQRPLVSYLSQAWSSHAIWLTMEPHHQLEEGERRLLAFRHRLPAFARDQIPDVAWKGWPLLVAVYNAYAYKIVRILNRLMPPAKVFSTERAKAVFRVLRATTYTEWVKWTEWLRSVRAKVVVGNSCIFDMASLAEACRWLGIPFIQLTHGMPQHDAEMPHKHIAPYQITYGNYWIRRMKSRRMRHIRRAEAAGPMHLQDELSLDEASCKEESTEILVLESRSIQLRFTESPREIELWSMELANAARTLGAVIRIRSHPRLPGMSVFQELVRRMQATGAVAHLDANSSLKASLLRARVVIISEFDTACAKALLCRKPIIAYIPHKRWPPTIRIVRRFARMASTVDELIEVVGELLRDDHARQAQIARQEPFLNEIISLDIENGWKIVENMIEEALREAGTNSTDQTLSNEIIC